MQLIYNFIKPNYNTLTAVANRKIFIVYVVLHLIVLTLLSGGSIKLIFDLVLFNGDDLDQRLPMKHWTGRIETSWCWIKPIKKLKKTKERVT